MTRITFITILSALNLFSQNEQITTNEKITFQVEADYIEGCETGKGDCSPIIITRQNSSDSIILNLPIGGTQSDVFLYDAVVFKKWMKGKLKVDPTPLLHDQKFIGQGNPQLDLTGLADGKYKMHFLSCGLGGIFELIIRTEED